MILTFQLVFAFAPQLSEWVCHICPVCDVLPYWFRLADWEPAALHIFAETPCMCAADANALIAGVVPSHQGAEI